MSKEGKIPFEVLLEAKVTKWVTVLAKTHEEAVSRAEALHQDHDPPRLRATWVDEKSAARELGELRHEVIGRCGRCETPIVQRPIEGQPWTYASDPDDEHGPSICHPCAKKAGVKGA